MLPKDRRIPRALFSRILSSSRRAHSPHFSLRMAAGGRARVAVSVSKKVSKKATTRNRIRRRAYAAIHPMLADLPGGLYLLVAKPSAEKIRGEVLKNELLRLIRSIRNWKL